jgi:predicted outer membrane lipoprotein
MAFVDLADDTPTLLHALDGVCLAGAVGMLVALWLPSTGGYIRSRRSTR